ncbi:MAG: amidohydrolase [Myxococcaceae bacterium]
MKRAPALVALALTACAAAPKLPDAKLLAPARLAQPLAPPPTAPSHPPTLLKNATVFTATGTVYAKGHVLLVDGRIAEVGEGDGVAPPGALIIDAQGGFITPGLIDTHSHMGVYPLPGTIAHQDGNEMTAPVTSHVRSESAFWPQDPALWRALAGGVTTIQVLPGSGNVIGGRSFVAHLVPTATSARAMKLPGAPEGLKLACGENPKRFYGPKGQQPMSRMGLVATLRASFQKAEEYRRARARYERDLAAWNERHAQKEGASPPPTRRPDGLPDDPPEPLPRDYALETLAEVLDGEVLVHNHCYRADEMHQVLDLAQEFGFRVRSFHHAVEAYKLADRLAKEGTAVSTWVDWWGFKMESFDGVAQNVALLHRAGARPALHSDSAVEVRRLNQEAAKARTAGRRFGLDASDDDVLRWVTANPAWVLGVDDQLGTLEKGKRADVVVWGAHPLSVYALTRQVFVDGALVYDRAKHAPPLSDFELGFVDGKELP